MEVGIELDRGDVVEIFRVASVGESDNTIEVVIHSDTELPDDLDLCTHYDVDVRALNSAHIEGPDKIFFEDAEIVYANENNM